MKNRNQERTAVRSCSVEKPMNHKKLAVLFPGNGYSTDRPLLYYAAKKYEAMGYEIVRISHTRHTPEDETLVALGETEAVLEFSRLGLDFSAYDDIVFIGKSLGTAVCGRIAERYGIPAGLVLLTPWDGTRPYLCAGKNVRLVVSGTADPYFDPEELAAICRRENLPFLPVPDAGHDLEIRGDIPRTLAVLQTIIEKV